MHESRQFRLRRAQLTPARGRRAELPEQRACAAPRPRQTKLDVDAVRAVEPREEELRAVTVQRRAYDDGTLHAALEQQRQRARRVLGRGGRGRLEDELDLGPAPPVAHLLRLRQAAAPRPTGEDDDVDARVLGDALGGAHEVGETLGTVMSGHDDSSPHLSGTWSPEGIRSPAGTWSRPARGAPCNACRQPLSSACTWAAPTTGSAGAGSDAG